LLLCGLGALAPALGPAADPPAKAPAKIDVSKLPPGAIFLVGEDAKDVLLQPGVLVLTPEKYKELLEQLDQLKRQVNPDKPEPPSSCVLTGRADEATVYLQAVFSFETRRPKTTVALGCQKAWPTAATLDDGKLPLLPPPGDDGFTVVVDAPGNHRLTLDLEAPITSRTGAASDRGFEIGLPRAVITRLERFDVPGAVRDIRINRQWLAAADLAGANPRRFVALGAAERLELTWKGPTPQEQAEPVREVSGQIDVRFDETHVITEAELVLSLLRGQTREWQVLIPPGYTMAVVAGANDDRATEVIKPADPKQPPVWTIRWKDPSNAPLRLRISAYQLRQRKVAVGPFPVLQALRQQGTISVGVPPELRLLPPTTRGDIAQRELTEEQRRSGTAAAFYYWSMPAKPNNQLGSPPLELEVENVKGAVETTLAHTLQLTGDGWRLSTEVEVNPVRTGPDRLEVDLPADYLPKAGPLLLVEPELEVHDGTGGRRVGVIKLAQRQYRPFKLTLEGPVSLRCSSDGVPAPAELPRMLQTVDRGARVSVMVPEDQELTIAREAGRAPLGGGRREASWRSERSPGRVEVAWRPRTVELPAECLTDVTIADGKARVRQSFSFQFPHEADRQMVLRGPDLPTGVVPTTDHAPLTPHGEGGWLAPLDGPALNVEYLLPLPKKGREASAWTMPLLWPAAATRCRTRVRVWADPGVQPTLVGGAWEEFPPEIVADRDALPALVLRADGLSVPLALRLGETTALHAATTIDRTLIQVTVPEGKFQAYRCRALLSRFGGRSVDLEFPAAVAGLSLEVYLAGKRIPNPTVIDEQGKESETGHAIRIRTTAEAAHRPVLLEVRYQLAFGRGEGLGRLVTVLAPPRFLGAVYPGPVRWQVGLGPDRIPVYWGGEAAFDQRWGWRGPLLAPQPAVTGADLERWIGGGAALPGTESVDGVRWGDLVGWQSGSDPVSLIQLPRQAWLLGCSLALLLVGLGAYFAPWRSALRGVAAVVFGAGAIAAGLWWPTTLAAVLYGIEPGAVVLAAVVAVLWVMQRRYRRQVVFMPGFSRPPAGSSIVRNGSSQRRRVEPSTVDSPAKLPSDIGSRQEIGSRKA
jgi:hypothetical protein